MTTFNTTPLKTTAWLVVALMGCGPAAAAPSCEELSYQRNAIYKDAGYCFKTAAQIRNFGNAGCRFDSQEDVPLSARARREIAEIVSEERALGCR